MESSSMEERLMGRKILFVTTDQQRYDTLGCNGGTLARTPVVDGLAAEGIRYERAHPQSVVCMPSRSTMITGQHPSTHGVWMNGVPLPVDAPSVAAVLHDAGYRTALIGKPHFEPFLDPFAPLHREPLRPRTARYGTAPRLRALRVRHARRRSARCTTPGGWPQTHPEAVGDVLPGARLRPGGQRARRRRDRRAAGARQRQSRASGTTPTGSPIARSPGSTRSSADDDWFCWMSFPDPHHPWDPPQSELGRVDWRDVPLPGGLHRGREPTRGACSTPSRATGGPGTTARLVSNYEAPRDWVPATLTADQVREVNARNAVECELIDEALGRVLAAIAARGLGRRRRRRSSRPTTASCKATSACCSRARTTSTR